MYVFKPACAYVYMYVCVCIMCMHVCVYVCPLYVCVFLKNSLNNTGILAHAAYLLPLSLHIGLYYSLVYSYLALQFDMDIYTYTTILHKLTTLHKRAICVVGLAGTTNGAHTDQILPYNLKMLKNRTNQVISNRRIFVCSGNCGLLPSAYKVFFKSCF